MSDADVTVDVDVDEAIGDMERWAKSYGASVKKAERSMDKFGDNTKRSGKQVEQSFLSMQKVQEKFASQLVEKFITIELAFRAVNFGMRELTENSKEAQRFGAAMTNTIDSLAEAFMRQDGLVSALRSATQWLNDFSLVLQRQGIFEALSTVVDIGGQDTGERAALLRSRGASLRDLEGEREAEKARARSRGRQDTAFRIGGQEVAFSGFGGNELDIAIGSETDLVSGLGSAGIQAAAREAETYLALEQRIADGKAGIRMSNLELLEGIARSESKIAEQQAREERDLLDMRAQSWAQFGETMEQIGGSVAGSLTQTLTTALIEVAKGNEVALDKMLADTFSALGQRLLIEGTTALASAAISAAFGNPLSAAQIAAGVGALATGTALLAGSIPALAATSGGGSAASPGLGAGRGVGGSGGGGAREVRDAPININIAGNVLGADEAEFGVVVTRAIRAARARG